MSCTWPVSYAVCDSCEPLTSLPASGQAMFEEMAVGYLRSWTSSLFGLCEITVRPCRQGCTDGVSTWSRGHDSPWRPVIIDGSWYNLSCGNCGDSCGCGHVEQLELPGPVDSITEIAIDGAVVPSGAYRVDSRKYLVRTDGGTWPECQDMSKNAGEDGTWSVTYQRGVSVPVGGQIAAGILACEFAKAACGDGTCQLPKRVQSVARAGVTVAMMLDTFDDLQRGATGIWLVDSWVASVTQARMPPMVYSPDLKPKGRRTTWP